MKADWLDDFELDGEAGPAVPLAPGGVDALAAKIADQVVAPGAATQVVRSSRGLFALTGVCTLVSAIGLVYAVSSNDVHRPSGAPGGKAVAVATPAVPTIETVNADGAPERAVAEPAAISVDALPSAGSALGAANADRALVATTTANAFGGPTNTPAAPSAPAKTTLQAMTVPSTLKVGNPNAPSAETASDLLERANRARGEREWTRAASLYERVIRSQADESYAATVALASLRLEHLGDAKGACVLYERALAARPGGVLSAQAEAGRVRCRRAQGEKDGQNDDAKPASP